MPSSRCAADHDGHRVTVATDDGVPLAVREFGDPDAPLTVVFVHGHCQRTECWSAVRNRLLLGSGSAVRTICYDHRGHGESGHGPSDSYTVDQLGRDLAAVLRAVAPDGPIVLVGHSMGAMTVLAYAGRFPTDIGSRVVGVGLLATAASGLTDLGLARLLRRPALAALRTTVRRAPRFAEGVKRASGRAVAPIVRETTFGTRRPGRRTIALATAMINETSVTTMTGFLDSLAAFDESATLPLLGSIPVLVLAGTADLLTPFAHSATIAAAVPSAELVCLDGAGHSVILERVPEVADALDRLIMRTGYIADNSIDGLAAVG